MASNASRGAAAKSKTKKWLLNRGYVVWDMEIVRTVWLPGGRKVFAKSDQLGADVGAMRSEIALLLVQVKYGDTAKGGTFPEARREFAKYPHPHGVRKVIMGWVPGARLPRIIECFGNGTFVEVQSV